MLADFKAREKLRETAWAMQKPLHSGQCGYSVIRQHLEESRAAAVDSSSSMPFAEALANKLDNEYDMEVDDTESTLFDMIEHERNVQVCCQMEHRHTTLQHANYEKVSAEE